jgi:hypothetical protein
MKRSDPLFFRLMSTWPTKSSNRLAHPAWRKLTTSSTNYKGWRIVYPPTDFRLDREALAQGGYPFSALNDN